VQPERETPLPTTPLLLVVLAVVATVPIQELRPVEQAYRVKATAAVPEN
tara:strand:- start:494 stop:640 length:147 start_codon:yes stop_codon:yes gene_type:complete